MARAWPQAELYTNVPDTVPVPVAVAVPVPVLASMSVAGGICASPLCIAPVADPAAPGKAPRMAGAEAAACRSRRGVAFPR